MLIGRWLAEDSHSKILRKEVIPLLHIIIDAKKEDSKESSQVSELEVAHSILDVLETAQDEGLEINFSIAYRR